MGFGSNVNATDIPDPSKQDDYWSVRCYPINAANPNADRTIPPNSAYPDPFITAGMAMDEWIYNNTHPDVYQWIETGLGNGRSGNPDVFVANWIAHMDSERAYTMTADGTVDLNMVQGYELTVQQGIGLNWNHGLARLEEFRQRGLIRKALFGMGHITDDSGWNGFEWDENLLRSRMEELKRKFPDMPGIAFFRGTAGDPEDYDDLVGLIDSLSAEYWPDLPVPDGLYSLTPQSEPGRRMDAENAGTTSGTDVIARDGNYPADTSNQTWRFVHLGDQVYKIHPVYSDDLCLDVTSANDVSGTPVQLYTDNGTDAQQWRLSKVEGGYQLRPLCSSDKFLRLIAGGSGGQAEIRTQQNDLSQVFALAPEVLKNGHVPPFYQLEDATLAGGAYVSSSNVGSMGGYIGMPETGASALISSVDGGSGGLRALGIRYASGFEDDRDVDLTVNGTTVTITLPPTGSWQDWETHTVLAPLNAGTGNSITLASAGVNPPGIDKITITIPEYQCEDAALSGDAFVSSNNPGSDGFAVGMDATPSALTLSQVEGGDGGVKGLKIRYINGFSTTRTLTLEVNGQTSGIDFPPTGSWSDWHELSVFRSLNAGMSNTISLHSNGGSTPGFDKITVDIAP